MSFFENKQESRDYHLFSTDNTFMNDLGLGTFTTGTLYDYWYKKDYKGNYANRGFTSPGHSGDYSPRVFFKCQYEVETDHWGPECTDWAEDEVDGFRWADGQFSAWNFSELHPNRGSYKFKKFSTWQFSDAHKSTRVPIANEAYRSTLEMSEFLKKVFTGNDSLLGGGKRFQPASGEPNGYLTPGLLSPKRLGGEELTREIDGLGYITGLINANEYIRWKKVVEPKISNWSRNEIAMLELLDDIKTSKSGCMSIPVAVEFDLAPGQLVVDKDGNETSCTKVEKFTINLKLFDEALPANHQPTAVLAHTKHAGVPISSVGQAFRDREDGEATAPDDQVLSDQVAADIDLFYNEYTGKWSSGGKQLLAKVVSTIGAATIPGVDALIASDIKETLENPDDDPAAYTMGTGIAMPINMQNGNQFQWTPSYLETADCRNDNKTKITLEVLNPSERAYLKDETVLLFEVDGKWFPMPYASGDLIDTRRSAVEGKWEFIQFATDVRHFFQGWPIYSPGVGSSAPVSDTISSKFGFKEAEQHFHREYYDGDVNNESTYNIDYPFQAVHGYDQMTSFDFMDKYVGGMRGDRRSFANTVWGEDPAGMSHINYDEDENSPRGWASAFFGAVFPDGYKSATEEDDTGTPKGGNPSDYVKTRSWNVKGMQPGIILPRVNQFFLPKVNGSGTIDEETGLAIEKGIVPFTEDVEDFTANDGSLRRRSRRSAPYYGLNNPEQDENNRSWFGPVPMFASVLKQDYSLKHLPADIALNGSPQCKNGGPLRNLSMYKYIHEYGGWITPESQSEDANATYYNPSETLVPGGEGKHTALDRWKDIKVADEDVFKGSTQPDFFREVFFNYRDNWLYKSQVTEAPDVGGGEDDGPTDSFKISDSAFDFEPIKNSRIQFRPLKMEVYCNQVSNSEYNGGDWADVIDFVNKGNGQWWQFFDYDLNGMDVGGTDQINKQHREYIWHFLNWNYLNDAKCMRSLDSIMRESTLSFSDGGGRDSTNTLPFIGKTGPFPVRRNPLYVDGIVNHFNEIPESLYSAYKDNPYGVGLAFNVDIDQQYFKTHNSRVTRIGGSKGPFSRHSGFNFDDPVSDPRNHWHDDPSMRPAGAVGVIGSICRVACKDSIVFTTQQTIGAQSIFGTTLNFESNWIPMWGGGNLKYDDFQTTDLSVRVFHAWPREQTIYDPRFFSVHHFNEGVTLPNDPDLPHHQAEDVGTAHVLRKSFSDPTADETRVDSTGDGIKDLSVANAQTDVDMRIPSYVNVSDDGKDWTTETRRPIPIDYEIGPFGEKPIIFQDFVQEDIDGDGNATTGNRRLLLKDHWALDAQRRGKLLPYNYRRSTIGAPFQGGTRSMFDTATALQIYRATDLFDPNGNDTTGLNEKITLLPDNDEEGTPVEKVALVVVNLGQGYKPATSFEAADGDKLELSSATGVEFMVMATGVEGCITELSVLNAGKDLDSASLLKAGTLLTQQSSSPSRLIRKTGEGKYFGAYITRGLMTAYNETDTKPPIATEDDYLQLSIKSDNTHGGGAGGFSGSSFIPVSQGERTVEAQITNFEANGEYDCFFHFHNDISHTWWGDVANARHSQTMVSHDQYITLDIDPN